MDVREGWDSVSGTKFASVLEDIIRYLGRDDQKSRVRVAKRIVAVHCGDSPAFVRQFFANALSAKLGLGVVKFPAVYCLFVLKRLVAEGIELLDAAELARPRLDKLESISRNLVVHKVECDKGKVSTSESYGGGLARRGGHRSKGAVIEHRKGNPSLPDLGGGGRILRGGSGLVDGRAEDEVVVGQSQGAIRCLTTVNALDICDDLERPVRGARRQRAIGAASYLPGLHPVC
jgi:hypothetical protein